MPFSFNEIPDLKGKYAIITGANTGLGKVTALEMARKGCHVILACRSKEKTDPVVEEIKKITGNENVEFMELDLSSLASVTAFSDAFAAKNVPLNILINNAGVMMCPFQLTKDGLENQIGTNHFGHFYLTMNLLPILEKNQPSRIVNLTSSAHHRTYSEGIRFDRINKPEGYSISGAYGQSKLCNILFAKELQKKLGDKQIYVNAVHPGWVATDLQRHIEAWGTIAKYLSKFVSSTFALTPEEGALTQLYVATSPEIEQKNYRGEYFVPFAKLATPSSFASNPELAQKLWDFTQQILKEKLGDTYQPPL